MAASFYESLEEKSSRLFFCCLFLGDECWVLGDDEVLRGESMGYYIGLIRQIGLIRLMGLIRLIRRIGLIHLFNKAN